MAHRPSALAAIDKLLMLKDGQQVTFGPKDEVLAKVLGQRQATSPPAAGTKDPSVTVQGKYTSSNAGHVLTISGHAGIGPDEVKP